MRNFWDADTESAAQSLGFLDGLIVPPDLGKYDTWPGYGAVFIRRPGEHESGDDAVPAREAMAGLFGLVPHWLKVRPSPQSRASAAPGASAGTASSRPMRFMNLIADRAARCPHGSPAPMASPWASQASGRDGVRLTARWYIATMLTVNADDHPLMRQFHKPGDEKRMVVILEESDYDAWLSAPAARSMEFLVQYPGGLHGRPSLK